MTDRFILGLDIGTSAVKGIAVSEYGEIAGRAKRDFTFMHPRKGWTELPPREHLASVLAVLSELADLTGGRDLAAVSAACASGNTVIMDEAGNAVSPIVSWMDARAAGCGAELLEGITSDEIHRVTGWPWMEAFPLVTLSWFKKNQPDLFSRGAWYGMNSDYIHYALTGRKGIDPSSATPSYLYNQEQRCWHLPYRERLELTEENLSPIMPIGALLGGITASSAEKTGLPEGLPVYLGSFDHPCAARGTGVLREGQLLISCGTSWVGFYPRFDRGKAVSDGFLVDPFLSGAGGPWGCMFSIPYIGQTVEWYIDTYIGTGDEIKSRYDLFNEFAAAVPIGSAGLLIDPLFDNGAHSPFSVPKNIGDYSREDIARAVMECIGFEFRYMVEEYSRKGYAAEDIVMVGGPAESPVWRQILADIMGISIRLGSGRSAGALGAAVLSGIGSGMYTGPEEGFHALAEKNMETVEPILKNTAQYETVFTHYLKGRNT